MCVYIHIHDLYWTPQCRIVPPNCAGRLSLLTYPRPNALKHKSYLISRLAAMDAGDSAAILTAKVQARVW